MQRPVVVVVVAIVISSFGCIADSAPLAEGVAHADPNKIDILFVVDNSGSMSDKQLLLSRTIMKPECPISDLKQVPLSFQNPPPSTRADLESQCGFAQLLAADDRDFRVGVITTDVDACDNFVPELGPPDWGFHPQRGCLQPDPSTGTKIITRDDDDVATEFSSIITSLGTFGSPFERGLDAADVFLTHAHDPASSWVADGCENDAHDFLRDDAQLLVVFVTDEDDCSHEDAATSFSDETLHTCSADASIVTDHNPGDCYSKRDALEPVAHYADVFRSLKPDPNDVSIAVIAGAVDDGSGTLIASGCTLVDDANGDAPIASSSCYSSEGLENFTQTGDVCDPDTNPALDGKPCCLGDAGSRYFELGRLLTNRFTAATICAPEFVKPLMAATAASP